MKNLEYQKMNHINAGGVAGCIGSVLGTVAVSLAAASIVAGTGGAGIALLGFGLAKAGGIFGMASYCSDI